ncbi:hypothetical protein lerEdw1_019984 [Lerista edwardsae]|nr:hypothetical protein lerEdw1_019984 [Lerista edwardsae]
MPDTWGGGFLTQELPTSEAVRPGGALGAMVLLLPPGALGCLLLPLLVLHLQESLQAVADFRLYVHSHALLHQDGLSRRQVRYSQLYSRSSSKHLQVLPSRAVSASGEDGDKYALLAVESDTFGSHVRIRGQETGLYLCMAKQGRVLAKLHGRSRACVFVEELLENSYTAFRSAKRPGWYLGFTRRGRPLRGSRIRRHHRQGHFVKRCLRHATVAASFHFTAVARRARRASSQAP